MKYNEAEHILCELIKINPYHDYSIQFLKKCRRRKKTTFQRNTRALSIALFLVAALLIAIEMLFIRTLFEAHSTAFEITRNITFVSGLLLLIGSDVFHRALVNKNTHEFVEEVRARKAKR